MNDVRELDRHASPGDRPQPLAFANGMLWVGCWDTERLYGVDPATWTVRDEIEAPGKPFGLASFGGSLRVVISLGEDDDRYLYEFVPGRGFASDKVACPEFTGSHLFSDGGTLFLVQATNRRIVALDAHFGVAREIALPTRCAGVVHDGAAFHMIAADDEFDVLQFATLDVSGERAGVTPTAGMSPEARGLAFDGNAWWTSYREQNEVVTFSP